VTDTRRGQKTRNVIRAGVENGGENTRRVAEIGMDIVATRRTSHELSAIMMKKRKATIRMMARSRVE
jgi:hypothetical protein